MSDLELESLCNEFNVCLVTLQNERVEYYAEHFDDRLKQSSNKRRKKVHLRTQFLKEKRKEFEERYPESPKHSNETSAARTLANQVTGVYPDHKEELALVRQGLWHTIHQPQAPSFLFGVPVDPRASKSTRAPFLAPQATQFTCHPSTGFLKSSASVRVW